MFVIVGWAILAFFLYKVTTWILTELRHHRNAKRLGCETPARMRSIDPFSIHNIYRTLQADKQYRLTQHFTEGVEEVCAEKGKLLSTFYQNVLGSPNVFTVDPRNIQTILATQFKDFGLGDTRNNNFHPLLGSGIFSTDGKEWQHARSLLRPQFARDQVSDLDFEERHVQNLMEVLSSGPTGWTEVTDLKPLLFRLTIDSATEFLFGESVDSQTSTLHGHATSRSSMAGNEKDFAESFDTAQAALARAVRLGDLYWLVHNKEFKEHSKHCHSFIDHYVQLALGKEKPSAQVTASGKQKYVFLDALVESTRDPVELRSHMISILLAGRDTTASLLSYVFMTFTQQPDIYAKLRAIILEDFGTYSRPKRLTFGNLKSCSYLQWVLNETLRVYPVVPINSRRALVDTTLPTGGGPDGTSPVYIRKDEEVSYSVAIMHRRKDIWGPDADEFRPERWNGRRAGWEYLPFNGGPRICIGQQFALTEAGYVVVRLLQRFDKVEGVGNSWEPVENGGMGVVRERITLTSSPADGVNIRFREAKE